MKRLAIIILTSTILLTGCSSNDKIAMLENAVKSSKDLIAKEEFEQAKGLLVYVSQNGGSKIDGYSNLNGQLDKLLLATEYYENEKLKPFSNYLRQKYPETKMTSFMESLYQEASEKMKDMLFEE